LMLRFDNHPFHAVRSNRASYAAQLLHFCCNLRMCCPRSLIVLFFLRAAEAIANQSG
jgi:hypothetical protein